jgi:sugar lactone lactonase YvrE
MSATARLLYRPVPDWEQLPAGFHHPDVADVAVDARDNVYVFTRQETRVIVYDRAGAYLRSWGEACFTRAHGITIGPDDTVYCVDDNGHAVSRFSLDGTLLGVIGPAGTPSDTGVDYALEGIYDRTATIQRSAPPYNRPTKAAIGPGGDVYVSDGYGNARVHRFSPDGELLASWGEPGSGPGQFRVPHSICATPDGRVCVADRENDRIQVFTPDGRLLEIWDHLQRPAGLACDRAGLIYVAENSWLAGQRSWTRGVIPKDEPGRVTVLDGRGTVLARLGVETDTWTPCAPGQFTAPHGIAVDSHGDIYVAEVTYTHMGKHGRVPPACHALQKLERQRV